MPNNSHQQQLLQLLGNELTHARKLVEILNAEYEALRQRDTARINTISQEKLACLQTLEQHTRARMRFLAEQGLDADTLIRSCPANSPVPGYWQELHTLAEQAQKQNEINGGIVALAQRHTRMALDILSGKDTTGGTYGPGGNSRSTAASHSLAKA